MYRHCKLQYKYEKKAVHFASKCSLGDFRPHQWEKSEVQGCKCKKAYLGDISPPPPLEESLFELFIQDYFKVLIIINNIQFHECGWPESTPSSQVKEERDRKGHPSVVCITLQCISRTDVVNITCALNFIILKNMLDFGQIFN